MTYDPQHPNHYRIVKWEYFVSGDYVNCNSGLARLPRGEEEVTHRVEFINKDDPETPYAYCVEVYMGTEDPLLRKEMMKRKLHKLLK